MIDLDLHVFVDKGICQLKRLLYLLKHKNNLNMMPFCHCSDYYFTSVTWKDDSHVLVTWLNRSQNVSIISICDVTTSSCQDVSNFNGNILLLL